MSFFRRPKPAGASAFEQPTAQVPFKPEIDRRPTEREMALILLNEAETQRAVFVQAAATRGLDRAQIRSAAVVAMNNDELPRFFRGISWRTIESPVPCVFLRGKIPQDALVVGLREGIPEDIGISREYITMSPDKGTVFSNPKQGFSIEVHEIPKVEPLGSV